MPELQPVRGIIVEDSQDKFDALNTAFQEFGGELVAHACSYDAAIELINRGILTPQQVDVAFLDSDLGIRRSEGRHLHQRLSELGYVAINQTEPNSLSVVTVGTSKIPFMAQEVGTPALTDGEPLTVEWDCDRMKALNIPSILQQVRLLKPALG